jgi:hypothetical protein
MLNFTKMNFPSTAIPTRPKKRDKPPIKQRLNDEVLQDNSGTMFYSGPKSIEQRSFDYETELLETSEFVPISVSQQGTSLHSSLPDEIEGLTQEASDYRHVGTQASNHSQDQISSAVKTDADMDCPEWFIEALEQSERTREQERKLHEYREKVLMEEMQAMRDLVGEYEKEILRQKKEISKQKNVEQELVQNLVSVLDELEVLRREKLMYEDETINLRVCLEQTDEDCRALGKQVKSERDQKERLLMQIEQERQIRIASETRAEEERRRFQALERQMKDDLQKRKASEAMKQEIKEKVGVPVKVRRIDKGGVMRDESLHMLTPAMITQMKTLTEQFAKLHPVKKIEYIMNDSLYKQFKETRAKFRSMGRGTKEVLVFHGTDRKNINSYTSIRPHSF